jgi:hypothetical protein
MLEVPKAMEHYNRNNMIMETSSMKERGCCIHGSICQQLLHSKRNEGHKQVHNVPSRLYLSYIADIAEQYIYTWAITEKRDGKGRSKWE